VHSLARVVGTSAAVLVLTLNFGSAGLAQSDDPPITCPGGQTPSEGPRGWICIPAIDPGNGSDPDQDPPGDGGDDGGIQGCRDESGAEIACSRGGLQWYGAPRFCYAGPQSPQNPPPAGFTADEGTWYQCILDSTGNTGTLSVWWAEGGAPPPVDPAVLAERALNTMQLATPNIHLAPKPPLMTYVGLPTWLWTDAGHWSDITASASAGATTVSVVAKPVRIDWDLTEGTTTCTSAGRAWETGMSASEETDCSYTFTTTSDGQTDDKYPVSAAITYQVDWTCSGTCLSDSGTLGEVDGVSAASGIRVGERQSVVVGGDD
jgi:hypothetical protein